MFIFFEIDNNLQNNYYVKLYRKALAKNPLYVAFSIEDFVEKMFSGNYIYYDMYAVCRWE